MTKNRLTMREAIFYQLVKNMQEGKDEYIPVFDFMGDVYCPELKLGGFVSHECSARLSEINTDNPNLLQIKKRKAKYSPNHYYCYRIDPRFTLNHINDSRLLSFYKSLAYSHTPRIPADEEKCTHGLPAFVDCPYCK